MSSACTTRLTFTFALTCFAWITGTGTLHVSAQVLDELRRDVRTLKPARIDTTPPAPEAPQTRRQFNRELRNRGVDYGWILAPAALVAAAPFWGPRILAHDNGRPASFCSFPYNEADDVGIISSHWNQPTNRKSWMSRARVEFADDLDDLSKIGGQLLIDSRSRFGFDTEFNHLREGLADNDDSLWMGDVNFVYRFAQSERLQMRSGIGFNWLSDNTDSDLGFNFTYGGDWFPVQPWIVSTEFDFGRIGHARLFHGRATLGVQVNRVELFAGYDYLDIRDAQVGAIVTGLRLWF